MKSNFSSQNLIFLIGGIILLYSIVNYMFKKPAQNEEFINSNKINVYNFNTTWCGHSVRFQPVWDEFCQSVKADKNILAHDIKGDDEKHKNLVQKYNVQGFPTVIIDYGNNHTQYSGPRTVNGLRGALKLDSINTNEVVNNQPVPTCGSPAQNNNVYIPKLASTTKKIYNFNTAWCGYSVRFQPIWNEFSQKNKDPNIEIIDVKCDDESNKILCSKYDVPGYPSVVKVSGTSVVHFNGDRTVEGLMKFASE